MEQVTIFHSLTIIPSILCVIAGIKVVLQKKENKLLAQQLTDTTNSLELKRKGLVKIQAKLAKTQEFQSSLDEAALTTQLQKPRLNGNSINTNCSTPEKYRYFRSMKEKGMSNEEIGSVLTISTHEAHQLVTLSEIARGN